MSGTQETIEADFIVVGAGSAGCVIAARLSEDPSTKVVVLEAGGLDTNRWIHIPLGFGKTFAELPAEVKNANSHRGQAARAMLALMRERWLS